MNGKETQIIITTFEYENHKPHVPAVSHVVYHSEVSRKDHIAIPDSYPQFRAPSARARRESVALASQQRPLIVPNSKIRHLVRRQNHEHELKE